MINEYYAKQHCFEDISLIENYEAAITDQTQTWQCHHRWETDRDLSAEELIFCCEYDYVPADRLIFLTVKEHRRLHNQHRTRKNNPMFGKHHSEAARKKMSEAKCGEKNHMFGKRHTNAALKKMSESLCGENNPMFGKHHSDATKEKMSESLRGMHWWNNGIISKFTRECPIGFKKGRL